MPGSVLISPPGEGARVRGNCRNRFESLAIIFPESELRAIAGDMLESEAKGFIRLPQKEFLDPVIPKLVHQLAEQLGEHGFGEQIAAEGMFLQLIGRMFALQEKKPAAIPEHERGGNAIVSKAMEFMRESLREKVTLAEIAGAANVSRTHLTRVFRTVTGRSVHDELIAMRVERAKELIKHHGRNMTLHDVALECGFSNGAHLSRIFNASIGTTPEQFRRQL